MRTNNIFLIALTAALPTLSQGQELRLSGGYNGSNVQPANGEGWTGRAGYQFGADLLLGDQMFLRTGLHLLVRNLDYTYAEANGQGIPDAPPEDFDYTSRSLRVPLQVGLHVLDPEKGTALNAYAVAGPSLLYTLNTRLSQDELEVTTTDMQGYLGFGLGATLGFLFIEGGYDVALSRAVETNFTDPKVNMYYLMGGLRLQLAR